MAVSAAAKSDHERLFGDRVPTLTQTDPELIEYFDNFAFDEVAADAALLDDLRDHRSARAVLPVMREQLSGLVIAISSTGGWPTTTIDPS